MFYIAVNWLGILQWDKIKQSPMSRWMPSLLTASVVYSERSKLWSDPSWTVSVCSKNGKLSTFVVLSQRKWKSVQEMNCEIKMNV